MKPKVAFICVHNSCRSQMAEAISKVIASDVFEAYSAGTALKPAINPSAVAVIADKYQLDMNKTQYSKLIETLPAIDIVITMGCNVSCPTLACRHREDWGLEDPTGQSLDAFEGTMNEIEAKVKNLMHRIQRQELL
ncbi:arsenate reductase ArsC [Erysipelothrix sp. HDW6C]|uniref:arsenate reductase ArsC n=1 Tax=Erysipelothrix sp. HDW6C TaxID=2714930 RepID=UPI00140D7ED8|nr:arsenate reductase ArsC [Erysipelothrix sp. HDW6C]QIK69443.1 arsenate reductase ArsC [Erysipelothrix sp. HDW6C]